MALMTDTMGEIEFTKVNHPSFSNQRFSIDSVITALTYAKMNPKAAVAVLFGEPTWTPNGTHGYPQAEAEEEGTCCIV